MTSSWMGYVRSQILGRSFVSRVQLIWVVAGVVVVCLAMVVLRSSNFDGPSTTGTTSREYGSLDDELAGARAGADSVINEAAAKNETGPDSPRGQERENADSGEALGTNEARIETERSVRNAAEASKAADAYRISGRSTRDFNREQLAESGFDEAEIDEIASGMRDYAQWLRDSSGGELPTPSIKLTPEEREVRRETRAGFLSDEEYDAALFATGQNNAAIFANSKTDSPAWEAGIRSGDVLDSINGVPIFELMDFVDGRDRMVEGGMHVLIVSRGGEATTVMVECCRPGWGPVDMTTRSPSKVEDAD